MSIELFPFYVAATVSLVSTLLAVSRYSPTHALIYFIISLLATAVVFFLLGAVLEIMIYAGAIVVLFLFVVMMLNLGSRGDELAHQWLKPKMWIMPSILCLILFFELVYVLSGTSTPITGTAVSPKEVGIQLFGPYVLAVEIASMLLLAALVGAYHLGRRYLSDTRGQS